MTKTGSTKNKILNLLTYGNKTLSEISEKLNLAPSTVSQHLGELKDMGAIEDVDTDHVRKWKYYRLNPNFNYSSSPIGEGISVKNLQRTVFYYAIAIGIVAVVAYFILFSNPSSSVIPQAQNGTYVPVRLTDPPNVPSGTQALVITYSSVAVHVNSKSASGWIESNNSGTIDLMSLVNVTQVIAGLKIAQNSTVDAARFNITSAEIEINNTVYNVTVPSGEVLAHITGSQRVNASTGVLVDLSPTVISIYTNNSTIFVMVPAVKAVVVPYSNATENNVSGHSIGFRARLDQDDIKSLVSARDNISITSTSLVQTNDSLSLSVTVKNNGNRSVTLGNLLVVGNQTPVLVYNSTCNVPPGSQRPVPPLWCRIAVNAQANAIGRVIRHSTNAMLPFVSLNSTASATVSTAVNITKPLTTIAKPLTTENPITVSTIVPATTENSTASVETQTSAVSDVTTPVTTENSGIDGNSGISSDHGARVSVIGQIGGGHFNVQIGRGSEFNYTSSQISASGNGSEGWKGPVDIKVELPEGLNSTVSGNLSINGTVLMHLVNPQPRDINGSDMSAFMHPFPIIQYSRGIEFLIENNGSLLLANGFYLTSSEAQSTSASIAGYTLQPGQSATFTFTGKVSLPGGFSISLVPGTQYRIEVFGTYGAHAISNVTAT